MTALTVESHPKPPTLGAMLALAGLGLVAGGFAMEPPHLSLLGVPLLLMGLALALHRSTPLEFNLTPAGIEMVLPDQKVIPWSDVEGISSDITGDPWHEERYPLHIYHSGGVISLPPRLSHPSCEVFNAIWDKLPPQGSADVPGALQTYLETQRSNFGPERVWAFRARSTMPVNKVGRGWWVIGALAVTGLVWVVAGTQEKDLEPWIGGAITLFVITLVSALILLGATHNPNVQMSGRKNSGLVISPLGIALVQGDLRGEMRWDELTKLEYQQGRKGLMLYFAGGQIRLADIYERGLPDIRNRLDAYWKPSTPFNRRG